MDLKIKEIDIWHFQKRTDRRNSVTEKGRAKWSLSMAWDQSYGENLTLRIYRDMIETDTKPEYVIATLIE